VSLYNQRGALGSIDPTPTVAVVGIIEKPEHITTQWFKAAGDVILLLGTPVDLADPLQGLGGSAYLKSVHGQKNGLPPRVDLLAAQTLHTTLLGLIREGVVKSAHDCSEGGLAVTLAESCFSQQVARESHRFLGATVDLSACAAGARLDALLFGETQNRLVISVAAIDAGRVLKQIQTMGVPVFQIGTVGGETLVLKTPAAEFSAPVSEVHDGWWNSIARAMA
jgi:phosphoribosylformylglycinamidine synthase